MEILIKLPCLRVPQLVGGAYQIRTREGTKVEAFLPLPWSLGSCGLMHSSGTGQHFSHGPLCLQGMESSSSFGPSTLCNENIAHCCQPRRPPFSLMISLL